jgi:hypothetical protein
MCFPSTSTHVLCWCKDLQTHRLAHVISQRVLEAIPTEESVKDFMSQEPKGFMIKRRFGGEMNPCKGI